MSNSHQYQNTSKLGVHMTQNHRTSMNSQTPGLAHLLPRTGLALPLPAIHSIYIHSLLFYQTIQNSIPLSYPLIFQKKEARLLHLRLPKPIDARQFPIRAREGRDPLLPALGRGLRREPVGRTFELARPETVGTGCWTFFGISDLAVAATHTS